MPSRNSQADAHKGRRRGHAEIAGLTVGNPARPLVQHDDDVARRYVCQIHKGGLPQATLAYGEDHQKVANDPHHCHDGQEVEGQYPNTSACGFYAEAGN